MDGTRPGQAHVSKHMQMLPAMGFVTRRMDGLFVYCALADGDVVRLCEMMCGRAVEQAEIQRLRLSS